MKVAFKTGNYKQQVVFIGGLTDGFLATECVPFLSLSKVVDLRRFRSSCCWSSKPAHLSTNSEVLWLMDCSYVEPLAKALEAEKWSLVQPLFTSSYTGFGTSSLKEVCFFPSDASHFYDWAFLLLSMMGTLAASHNLVAGRWWNLVYRSVIGLLWCTGCNRDWAASQLLDRSGRLWRVHSCWP